MKRICAGIHEGQAFGKRWERGRVSVTNGHDAALKRYGFHGPSRKGAGS